MASNAVSPTAATGDNTAPATINTPTPVSSATEMVEYTPDSHDLMVDAARMARMAYTESATIAQWWQDKMNGTKVPDADTGALFDRLAQPPVYLDDPESDAQGYGLMYKTASGPIAVLAFRGTSSLADAVADSEVQLVPLKSASVDVPPRLLVHRGFLGQFLRLEKECDAFLKQTGLANVLCVGHSLAASISTIAATVYGLQNFNVSCIGFGQPRPGTKDWASVFNKVVQWSIKYKHSYDPVDSCLPPVVYTHVGEARQVGCPDPYPDLCLLWDLPQHAIDLYLSNIKINNTVPPTPVEWLPYIKGLVINTPLKIYFAARNFSFM